MKTKIPGWKACYYREVYKILQLKDGCIYKTESIGFIHMGDIEKYPWDKFTLSNIPTRLSKQQEMTLNILGK